MRKILLVLIAIWLFIPTVCAQKVGLVLSGGGAKGLTHIGIIRALEENNIPIDYITGTSMGAIIGSLYAMGYSPDDMEELLKSEDFKRWYSGQIEEKYVYHFKKMSRHRNFLIFVFVQRLIKKFQTTIFAHKCGKSHTNEFGICRFVCTCYSRM